MFNMLEFLKCFKTSTNTLNPESTIECQYEYVTRMCFTLILFPYFLELPKSLKMNLV